MATKKTAAAVPAPYDDSKWQAEDDVRTLMRAAEIRKDKARFARAKVQAKAQLAALTAAAL